MREDSALARRRGRRRRRRRESALVLLLAGVVLVVVAAVAVRSAGTDPTAGAGAHASHTGSSGGAGVSATPPSRPAPSVSRPSAPPPAATFPDASNTGVPSGVSVRPYHGPCTINTAGTVIAGRDVRCDLMIKAQSVAIRQSRVTGTVTVDDGTSSVRIEDSEVDGGTSYQQTIGYENVTLLRTEIRGGQHSVSCRRNCHIEDSWLHGQHLPPGEDWHLNAFISNGGRDIRLVHNTLACDNPGNAAGGGCTADAAIFGDFSGNSHYTFERNLFVASVNTPYCTFAGHDPSKEFGTQVQYIVYIDNVFQRGESGKCGTYGPVTSFAASSPGNVWRNNVWDDGTPVYP
jgi:hypothetical protein